MNAVVVIEPVLCFFELFPYFSVVGDVPTPANFARQF